MGATSQLSEKKLRNDSEPRCRGCLNWLKKCKHPEKCKKSSNQLKIKIIINSKISAKGGPVFTFSLPGGAARSLTPPLVTPLFSVRLCGWCMISVHSEKIGRQARISAFSGCVNSCKKFFFKSRFWATSGIPLCQTRVRVRWRQSLAPHCASRSSRSGRQPLAWDCKYCTSILVHR